MIYAVEPTPCTNYVIVDGQRICGKLVGISNIGDLINVILSFLLPVAAIVLFLVLVWGGFEFLTSGGNPEKVKSAQAKITSSLIGFFIIVFAYAATRLVSNILGFQSFF